MNPICVIGRTLAHKILLSVWYVILGTSLQSKEPLRWLPTSEYIGQADLRDRFKRVVKVDATSVIDIKAI